MTDLNKVFLTGRLTQDLGADERSFGYVGNGQARANISIAVNRSKKNGDQWVDEANFFNVTIWGRTAENLKPYLKKGKSITVEGYLKQDRWEKDGQKQSRIGIVAENVWLNGGRDNSSPNANSRPQQPPQANDGGFSPDTGSGFNEDIPF